MRRVHVHVTERFLQSRKGRDYMYMRKRGRVECRDYMYMRKRGRVECRGPKAGVMRIRLRLRVRGVRDEGKL